MANQKKSLKERFNEGLLKANNGKLDSKKCWKWSNSSVHGYGQIGDGSGGVLYAHRVAWELANGPIPKGLSVGHQCNGPRNCCNPNHLVLTTPAANTAYMFLSGRNKKQDEKKPAVRMTKQEKLGIVLNRLNGRSFYFIAKKYNRGYQHVKNVYERWLKRNSNDLIAMIEAAQDSLALPGVVS